MSYENIDKLLSISSNTYEIKNKLGDKDFDEQLSYILKNKNGFYVFESALHFFSDNEIKTITNSMKKHYNYENIENCIFFAEDIFGNLFCYNNYLKTIFLLDLESGNMEECGSSFEDWSKNILEDYDYLTGYNLAHDWQIKNGSLGKGVRLMPKIPFVLGGEYNINNLQEVQQIEGIRKRFNLYKQIKDLDDGAKIILD